MDPRNDIIETLRGCKPELEAMGVRHLALFGSHVRGDQRADSDIDIGVKFAKYARSHPLAYFGIRQRVEDRLSELLAVKVDLSDEEMQRPDVKDNYEQDRVYAF